MHIPKFFVAALCSICLISLTAISSADASGTITSPRNNDKVNHVVDDVTGTCTDVPADRYVWLVVKTASTTIHPQSGSAGSGPISQGCSGSWNSLAYFGADPESNVGEKFTLMLVAVDEDSSRGFTNYLRRAAQRGVWTGIPMPKNAVVLDEVTVIRR